MKVVFARPPNYDAIAAVFPLRNGIVFTYGDTCFNPDGGTLTADLRVHEGRHCIQQENNPVRAATWWDLYLSNPEFRLSQEIEAYGDQYAFIRAAIKERNKAAGFLHNFATVLSSPLYGSMVSLGDAMRMIRLRSNDVLAAKNIKVA